MSSKVNLLFFSDDLKMVKDLQTATKSFAAEVSFVPCSSLEKFLEYGEKFKLDAAVVDEKYIDPLAEQWVDKHRKRFSQALGNHAIAFFFLGAERDISGSRALLKQGFEDLFSKPLDSSLFFQKLQLFLPNARFLKEKLLFNMPVNSEVDLASAAKLVNASEYGVQLQTKRPLSRGDLFTIYGKIFSENASGACLSKVLNCSTSPNSEGNYDATLIFISPTKDILKSVRLWIKQEYIRSNE